MTKDEIIEGNKLIAEFMGWKLVKYIPEYYPDQTWLSFKNKSLKINYNSCVCVTPEPKYNTKESTTEFTQEFFITYCNYHKEWNWLMPVVDKIRDIKNECKLSNKDVYNRKDRGFGLYSNKFLVNTNFNYTYNGVIEFIKWYSENK